MKRDFSAATDLLLFSSRSKDCRQAVPKSSCLMPSFFLPPETGSWKMGEERRGTEITYFRMQ